MRTISRAPGQSRSRRDGIGRTAMRRVSMRPCPFSTVSARRMSLGSIRSLAWPGRLASLEGGIVAEGVPEFRLQFRLVGFDEQEVVAAPVADRLGDLVIGE